MVSIREKHRAKAIADATAAASAADLPTKTAVDQVKAILQQLRTATKLQLDSPPWAGTTAATAVGHQVAIAMVADPTDDYGGYGLATFFLYGAAHSGYNVSFEMSHDSTNGTNGTWFPCNAALASGQTVAGSTGVLTNNSSTAWRVAAPGASWVRAKVGARTSGTLSMAATASAASYEPAPPVQTHGVTQSGNWSAALRTDSGLGSTPRKVLSAATSNPTSVIAAVAALYGYHLANTSAAWKYFRLFNKASAPTVGTDSPVMVIPIPPGGVAQGHFPLGIRFATGLAYAITGAAADLDNTAVAANDVVGFLSTS